MFGDPARLAALYPRLIQHALLSFGSRDVLRFLGHRVPLQGPIHPKFAGQVLTDLKVRPEGVRLKHRVGSNSLKMYDKFGRGLRVETTINNPRPFRIFRRPEGSPDQPNRQTFTPASMTKPPRRFCPRSQPVPPAVVPRLTSQVQLLAPRLKGQVIDG
jgi:hypothetical protein